MNSYDAAWNAMCYLAAFGVLTGVVYLVTLAMREAKERRQEDDKNDC